MIQKAGNYFSQSFVRNFVLINILFLLVTSFFILPTTDTYYYWTWSKHLQLSYYDGPPMIAYLIWLTTHLVGNNFFALNIISVLCIIGSAFLIYKISCNFTNRSSAQLASLIWLAYPFSTTRFITISMTLDGLEVFFSLLIILFTCRLIKDYSTKNIYYLGIAVGFGLLAKYNVIILVIGIMLFFALNSHLRKIYLNPHLYAAIVISMVIFSPVLIWNYQNGWSSFYYQLNSHNWSGGAGAINSAEKHGLKGMWFYLKSCVFGVLHILLILSLYLRYKLKIRLDCNLFNKLLLSVFAVIILFWLYKSYTAHVGLNYMVTASAILMIILAQQLIQVQSNYWFKVILILFTIISLIMQIDRSRVHPKDMENYNHYVKTGQIVRPFFN